MRYRLILICFFILCTFLSSGLNYDKKIDNMEIKNIVSDTIVKQDTILDVNGKVSLFIGDSHTANHHWGWQMLLCDKTGMKMNNTAVGGKITSWMIGVAKESIHSGIDYCFIWGGANDMYGSVKATKAVENIQQIVNICNLNGVKPIVLTGFDAKTCCVTPNNPGYPKRYAEFQQMLLDSIEGAKVLDTRVVVRKDCGDAICHMNPSGHKKISESVIKQMNFKIK